MMSVDVAGVDAMDLIAGPIPFLDVAQECGARFVCTNTLAGGGAAGARWNGTVETAALFEYGGVPVYVLHMASDNLCTDGDCGGVLRRWVGGVRAAVAALPRAALKVLITDMSPEDFRFTSARDALEGVSLVL